jgi:hypothetical protein
VETTNGKNSVISKLMTFVENAETGEFLFLITVITLIASLVHDVIHAKIVIHIRYNVPNYLPVFFIHRLGSRKVYQKEKKKVGVVI